jgi:hypothetical protein
MTTRRMPLPSRLLRTGVLALALGLVVPRPAVAFFEDLCINSKGRFENCIIAQAECLKATAPDQTCPRQVLEALADTVHHRAWARHL